MDKWGKIKHYTKRTWKFFWKDDSIWSWIVNIIVAFLVIRFLIYPLLGVILGTGYPIVAVISESMEHGVHNGVICGQNVDQFRDSFDNYWNYCGEWYENKGITPEQFKTFPFKNGFEKGDVIILWRANKNNLEVGDVLIFKSTKPQPIIHRIVEVKENTYQTKGDHNKDSIGGSFGETDISEDRILGKGAIKIPYLGWLKILFVDAVKPLGINIQR